MSRGGRRTVRLLGTVAALVAMGACAEEDGDDAGPDPSASASVAAGTASTGAAPAAPTTTSTSTTTSTPTSTTLPPTTTTPMTTATTVVPGVAGLVTDAVQVREIGRSVQGRPITAVERGTPGGRVVLVIGVIHGDEDDGVPILERLATAPVPAGVDLWLIESMNPDGQVLGQRWNANGVDLNRNFPYEWGPIGEPGHAEYAGTGAASEPETRAVVDFVGEIRPALGVWYHQDLFRLSPGQGFEAELKQRYAEITGLPVLRITGGTYTGIAATWQRHTVDGIAFIVELGPALPPAEADAHAAAVLELASMVAGR